MWIFDAVWRGFQLEVDDWRLQLFRVVLGAACTAKFSVALTHGGISRLEPDGLGRFGLEQRFGQRRGELLARLYRPVLFTRLLGAVLLLVGFQPKPAACVVVLGLLYELSYAHRFNTIYLAMVTACLLPAGALGEGFALAPGRSTANTWSQFLIVLITIDLYWNSAWQKIRSRQFTSGLLLAQFVHFIGDVRHRLRYREFFYPRIALDLLGRLDEPSIARWRVIAALTIGLELVLPVALLWTGSYLVAVLVGVLMHLGFTALMPRQLLGFSIATAGSYLLFMP